MMMRRVASLALGIALAVSSLSAQDPAFDVVSVKVVDARGAWTYSPGAFRVSGSGLRTLIALALDIPLHLEPFKLVWPKSVAHLRTKPNFEIHGKGDPENDWKMMLRTLLRDRFRLRTRVEMRDTPVNELTVRDKGKFGRWFKPVAYNCRDFILGGGKRGDADSPTDGV